MMDPEFEILISQVAAGLSKPELEDRIVNLAVTLEATFKCLERIAAATPNNTNSETARDMASWTQAVARTFLADYYQQD